MGVRGWVYVISNPAMLGLVKVGYSLKDPALRAQELEGTGTPHPFKVEYEVLVYGPREIEQAVHAIIMKFHERKEWFRCSIADAISAIRLVGKNEILVEKLYDNISIDKLKFSEHEKILENPAPETFISGYCPKGNRVNIGIPCHECSRFECRDAMV